MHLPDSDVVNYVPAGGDLSPAARRCAPLAPWTARLRRESRWGAVILGVVLVLLLVSSLQAQNLPRKDDRRQDAPLSQETYVSPLGQPREYQLPRETRCWWIGKMWTCKQ